MTSERGCFVYVVPPGATEFVTAGRFRWIDDGAAPVGQFVYGRSYREHADAVELDPVESRLSAHVYETAREAIRSAFLYDGLFYEQVAEPHGVRRA